MQGHKVFSFPPSQEFCQRPQLVEVPEGLRLVYDQEGPTGEYETRFVVFKGVLGYRCTRWGVTQAWMTKAYDVLWEWEDSGWLQELKGVYRGQSAFDHKHFVVFFDDHGFYEVIAKEFEAPTE